MKTFGNTTSNGAKKNVKDIKFWGNGDMFKLLSKASSQTEGWMKSTKAMEIEGVGCVVQVTTQQRNETAMNAFAKNEDGSIDTSGDMLCYDCKSEASDYSIAEAVTFIPNVKIEETKNDNGDVVSRKLVKI